MFWLTQLVGATPFLFLVAGGALSVSTAQNILLHTANTPAEHLTKNATQYLVHSGFSASNTNATDSDTLLQIADVIDGLGHGVRNALVLPLAAAGVLVVACLLVSRRLSHSSFSM